MRSQHKRMKCEDREMISYRYDVSKQAHVETVLLRRGECSNGDVELCI